MSSSSSSLPNQPLPGTQSVSPLYTHETRVTINGQETLKVTIGFISCGELQEITETFSIGPSKHAIESKKKRKAWLASLCHKSK